ncbi:MAG: hypothetical protein V1661_00500 [bacterium]
MNFRQYIILMSISSVLAWLTWAFIVFGINPDEAGLGILFLFYISLLLALSCSLSIAGLIIRVWALRQKELVSRQAAKSFRQAILLATLLTGILYFQSKHILNWWIIALFIAALSMLEFFLISYKKPMQNN